jgi:hypothetical protein
LNQFRNGLAALVFNDFDKVFVGVASESRNTLNVIGDYPSALARARLRPLHRRGRGRDPFQTISYRHKKPLLVVPEEVH